MADKKATIIIEAEDRASDALNKVKNKGEDLAKSLAAVGASFTAVGAATLVAVKSFIASAAEMEQQRVSFEVLTGSVELGQKKLKELTDFASKTPFEIPQILEQSKRLLAMGIAADDLIPTFKNLGNIASGVGMEKLPQLVLAFGQVKAATKLTGMELRQFTEAGVPLLQALVDKANESGGALTKVGGASKDMVKLSSKIATASWEMDYFRKTGGKTDAQLATMQKTIDMNKAKLSEMGPAAAVVFKRVETNARDMIDKISDGAVTFDQVKAALEGMDDEGGKFFQMMEKQAQTTAGQISNFNDKIFMTKNAIGSALLPTVNELLGAVTPLLARLSEFVTANPEIAKAFIGIGLAIGAVGAAMLAIVPIILLVNSALFPQILLVGAIGLAIALVIAAIIYWKDSLIAFVTASKPQIDLFVSYLQKVLIKAQEVASWFTKTFGPAIKATFELIKDIVKIVVDDFVKNTQSIVSLGQAWISKFNAIEVAVRKAADAISWLIGKYKELVDFVSGNEIAKRFLSEGFKMSLGSINPFLGMISKQHGGIVPGGAGDAVPALLHGGERVVSRTGTDVNTGGSSSGTTVNLIIEGDVNSMDMVRNIVDAVKGALGRDSELAQLGVSI